MPAAVERSRLQRSTFLVLFALAAYAFWRTLEPIWMPVLLGLVIAVGVYPLHEKLVRRLGGKHPGLPAALLTTVVMALSLALLGFLVFVVGQRVVVLARDFASSYEKKGAAGLIGHDLSGLLERVGVHPADINQRMAEEARDFAAALGRGATSLVAGIFSAIFIFIFTALTSYYLLREGKGGTSWLVEMVPLPNGQVAEIVRDVRDVMRAMLVSTGAMSAYQGVVAGLGYWIFGVDSPLVWASLTGIASILPGVGTALVWAPVGIVTILAGHPAQGIGILLWSAVLVVFVADYILRPKLVGTRIRMNDLLVFIAIFGGIEAFGILGVVLGPIAVAVLLSLIRIYQRDYRPEGPVRAHDPTASNGSHFRNAP
ncbi:MAG TPA: AI-2E family transporter [Myxococcales bacterium]|nr:AI-2E family transporter [Myxococcales bacterium]